MAQPQPKLSIRVGAAPMAQDLEYLRRCGLDALLAGLKAVAPQKLMQKLIKVQNSNEFVFAGEDGETRSTLCSQIIVVGGGKASAQMCEGLIQAVDGRLPIRGILNVPHGSYPHAVVSATKARIEINFAAHPLPDACGLRGVERMVELIKGVPNDALVVALISGGGSALMPAPAPGITLEEKQAVNKLLLASGAAIAEINTVRKHLSQLKGGQLARLVFPRRLVSFILSDVVGNDIQVIASGTTVPDASTFGEAIGICNKYALLDRLPVSVRRRLEDGAKGLVAETPKPADPCFAKVSNVLIGSADTAAKAARQALRKAGFDARIYSNQIAGEAREYGQFLVQHIDQILVNAPQKRYVALIGTGELTVTLRGSGKGGRNQEMLVSFLLAQRQLASGQWQVCGRRPRWAVMAGAFDGIEGNSECFGALIDSESLMRTEQMRVDLGAALASNDSNSVFRALNDALVTGHTQTNVNDMVVVLLDFGPPSRL